VVKGGNISQILILILIVLDLKSITCLEEWNFIILYDSSCLDEVASSSKLFHNNYMNLLILSLYLTSVPVWRYYGAK
jgi:hypothetical protein